MFTQAIAAFFVTMAALLAQHFPNPGEQAIVLAAMLQGPLSAFADDVRQMKRTQNALQEQLMRTVAVRNGLSYEAYVASEEALSEDGADFASRLTQFLEGLNAALLTVGPLWDAKNAEAAAEFALNPGWLYYRPADGPAVRPAQPLWLTTDERTTFLQEVADRLVDGETPDDMRAGLHVTPETWERILAAITEEKITGWDEASRRRDAIARIIGALRETASTGASVLRTEEALALVSGEQDA